MCRLHIYFSNTGNKNEKIRYEIVSILLIICYTTTKKTTKEATMEYASVAKIAEKWGISERSVRNYCAQGRIAGAKLIGKTWYIPADARKPERA